jgi:uncharacterized protein (DUF1501 family)
MSVTRRAVLGGALSLAGLGFARLGRAGVADAPRFVFMLLRGAMDGLAAVPVPGDPDWGGLGRGEVTGPSLDGTFALHPELAPLEPWFRDGDLAIVHATCMPYDQRSHFDGQDVLESGVPVVGARRDGWLGRAIGVIGAKTPAFALGDEVPLVLRGSPLVTSYDPTRSARASRAIRSTVEQLWASDPLLGAALVEARRTEALVRRAVGEPSGERSARAVAEAAGRLLAAEEGPDVVVLELDGWDTHTGQDQRLGRQLAGLATGLTALRGGLGDAWRRTVVVVATEFGRTARVNGTAGTDHGVGGAALVAGGAVRGGRVIADWPGLSTGRLHDGRDLRATTDLRSILKAVVIDHLGVAPRSVDTVVFPGSSGVSAARDLVRA